MTDDHDDAAILEAAKRVVAKRFVRGADLSTLQSYADYLVAYFADKKDEHFIIIYLDVQHRVIDFEVHSRGTISGADIAIRRIVREAMDHNAAAIIIAHNHPSSGSAKPSPGDLLATRRIQSALQYVDVRLRDHVIVGGADYYSMMQKGQLT